MKQPHIIPEPPNSTRQSAAAWTLRRLNLTLQILMLTLVFGTLYILVQQSARLQANDTPRLLAVQVVKQLNAGLGLSSVNMGATDLANDPVPFVIIYDKQGKAVGGSGYLDDKLAVAPKSMLTHAKTGSDNSVTWSPKAGVRIASVTVAAKSYYVLGGQSLKQTEAHATRLFWLTATAYGVSILICVGYTWVRSSIIKL